MSVGGKAQVGKFYENVGDDYLTVNVTYDKKVLEIEQWDAIGRRMNSVNFFADSAPQLIKLIEKAAGIKADPTLPHAEKEMGHAEAAGWHCTVCGRGSFGEPCTNPEPKEDPYEYAAMRIRNHDRAIMAWPELYWTDDKEDIEELVETMDNARRAGYNHSYVVAKRRKAGEIEYT